MYLRYLIIAICSIIPATNTTASFSFKKLYNSIITQKQLNDSEGKITFHTSTMCVHMECFVETMEKILDKQ